MKVLLCNTIANYKNQDKFLDEVIKSIDNLELDYTRYYDIKLFSEKLEFEVRKLKKKDKKEGISEKIEQLKKILNINLDKDIKNILLIKHHIGKFYVWLQEYNEAEKIFVEIKNVDSEAYSSVLQLCRIYKNLASSKKIKYDEKKEFIDKGKENIKYILDGNNQPITVLLSAYELISKKPFYAKELIEEYLNKRFEEFGDILKESINNEFDQTYLVLKEFSGWLSYNKPNFYKNLLEYLEPPAYIKENKKLLLAYGQIYSKEFSRKKYHNEEFDKELNIAETYLNQYISMIEFDREKFNFKFLIDLYLESNKFKEADELINEIYDSENPYHLKWKCIIYRDRNDFEKDLDKSLQLIEKAIDIIEQISNKGKYYMAAFYNEYADTLKAIDDSKCIQTLKKALSFKKEISGNLKRDWTEKLEEWEKEFD
ncbi:hypothetical protein ACFIJ5_07475 [Haloimpatiens sp. FM7330]|uniref:hypothetical protein n=1 Tax=Haloimpatiens sp. FM7330 TaxID=3298610 RepID=UPI003631EE57